MRHAGQCFKAQSRKDMVILDAMSCVYGDDESLLLVCDKVLRGAVGGPWV